MTEAKEVIAAAVDSLLLFSGATKEEVREALERELSLIDD